MKTDSESETASDVDEDGIGIRDRVGAGDVDEELLHRLIVGAEGLQR
uniref:Uncharacterized protein n=1 Tax=Nelumbo nucifera TaxID=4432 RepID=A0A822YGY7_NELNU|nr:TPA_asm: hypothetical protein HUJ06_010553 [Nelumbo nucifera]